MGWRRQLLLLFFLANTVLEPVVAGNVPQVDNKFALLGTDKIGPKYPTNTRIGIIGGGMNGILMYDQLSLLGYNNIVVFEAAGKAGGLTETTWVNGKPYDWAAHLVCMDHFGPTSEWTATGRLMARFPQMTVHNETITLVETNEDNYVQQISLSACMESIVEYQPLDEILRDTRYMWDMLFDSLANRTAPGQQGLNFPHVLGDTFDMFATRQPPVVSCLLSLLANGGDMRRRQLPAEFIFAINSGLTGVVGIVIRALVDRYPDRKPYIFQNLPEDLVAQLGHPVAGAFDRGYAAFMDEVMKGMDVRVNHKVLDVSRTKKRDLSDGRVAVTFSVSGGMPETEYFDHVIITTRPAQTREYLKSTHGEYEWLFSKENCPLAWTRSYLINATGGTVLPKEDVNPKMDPQPHLVSQGLASSLEATRHLGFAVIEPFSAWTGSDVESAHEKITACELQAEGTLWMCFSNCDEANCLSDEEAWKVASASLKLFQNHTLVDQRISNWPVFPSAKALRNGWYDRVNAVQGRDGIYISGEIMSGPTNAPIMNWIELVVPAWFGDCGSQDCEELAVRNARQSTIHSRNEAVRQRNGATWSLDNIGATFAVNMLEVIVNRDMFAYLVVCCLVLFYVYNRTFRSLSRQLGGRMKREQIVTTTHHILQLMVNMICLVPYTYHFVGIFCRKPDLEALVGTTIWMGQYTLRFVLLHFLLFVWECAGRHNNMRGMMRIHHALYFCQLALTMSSGTTYTIKVGALLDYFIVWEVGSLAALVVYRLKPDFRGLPTIMSFGMSLFCLSRLLQAYMFSKLVQSDASKEASPMIFWIQNILFVLVSSAQLGIMPVHLILLDKMNRKSL